MVKAHSRRVKRRGKRARKRRGTSYKRVKVRKHRRKKTTRRRRRRRKKK